MLFLLAINSPEERNLVRDLYNENKYLLFYIANDILKDRFLTEDAINETFVKLIDNLHKVKDENREKQRAYLAIICRNTAFKMLDGKTPLDANENAVEEALSNEIDETVDLEGMVLDSESHAEMVEIIYKLPKIYQDVLMLRIVHNHNNKEIADILGISIEAVKKRLTRARQKIIVCMNERGKHE